MTEEQYNNLISRIDLLDAQFENLASFLAENLDMLDPDGGYIESFDDKLDEVQEALNRR